MVCVIAATIAMFKHPTYVLVGAILVFELLCLALVLNKVFTMLDESDAAAGEPGSLRLSAFAEAARPGVG
jgi:hypothetical protein